METSQRLGPNGEIGGDILDRLPLALQPPFISHQLMGTCFYLGGLLEYLRKARKSVFVVETETCDRDTIGIPAWLGRSTGRQLPLVMPVLDEMPHKKRFAHTEREASACQSACARVFRERHAAPVECEQGLHCFIGRGLIVSTVYDLRPIPSTISNRVGA